MIKGDKRSKRHSTLFAISLIVVVGLFGLTSCTKQPSNTDPSSTPEVSQTPDGENTDTPDTGANESGAPAENSDAGSQSEPPKTSGEEPQAVDYNGEWTVSQVLAYGPAGTYSSEEAEKMVGKILSFSADEASIINDQPSEEPVVIEKPEYQVTEITKDDFLAGYQITLDKVGIDADTVVEAIVSGSDGLGGCTLFISDGDTMVLAAGGTFFKLVR